MARFRLGTSKPPAMSEPIRVFLADRDPRLRDLIGDLERDLLVVGQVSNGEDMAQEVRRVEPTIILVDIDLPETGGLQSARLLIQESPSRAVLIVTNRECRRYLLEAARIGAQGYLVKLNCPPEIMLNAIKSAVNQSPNHHRVRLPPLPDGLPLSTVSKTRDTGPNPAPLIMGNPEPSVVSAWVAELTSEELELLDKLTEREREILQLLGQGLNNMQIAEHLVVQKDTVKSHVQRIYGKLNITRAQAIRLAILTELRS